MLTKTKSSVMLAASGVTRSSGTATTHGSSSSAGGSSSSGGSSGGSGGGGSSSVAGVKGVGSSIQAISDLDRQKVIIQAIFQQDTPHRDLMKVYLELYTSEVSYVISLHKIVLYAIPEAKKVFHKDPGGVEKLFGNIEELRDVHVALLDALVDRYKKWSEASCVADVLLTGFEQLRPIYAHYCAHYESASQLLPTFTKKKSLVQFTERVQAGCEQPLPALLIMPVQRLPRYRMLLEDLLKRMEKAQLTEHPDFAPLHSALQLIGSIADQINASLREAASQRTAAHVMKTVKGSEVFAGTGSSSSSNNRRIIADAEKIKIIVLSAEGALKLTNQTTQATYDRAILLTDTIVFCAASTSKGDSRHDIMEQVPVHLLWVDDNVPAGYDVATSLRFLTPEQDYVVTCGSRLERESWRSTVTNGIQSWVDAQKLGDSCAGNDGNEQRRKFEYQFSGSSALLPGATYNGEWAHAKPDGIGTISRRQSQSQSQHQQAGEGEVYEGQIVGGRKSGLGTMIWQPSGSSYEGQWQKDLPHGQGTLQVLHPTDKQVKTYTYTGAWYLGRRHGEGSSKWLENGVEMSHTGTTKNDRFDGSGVFTVAGYSVYEGEFLGGLYHGKGTLELTNGDRYVGTWVDGLLDGHAHYLNQNTGMEYDGEWLHNRFNGEGTLSSKLDGWRYQGSFRDGLFQGQGKASYADGSTYEGHWELGQWHGKGVFTQTVPHKLVYDGGFVRGFKEGQGSLTTDRFVYTGSFECNRPSGNGELTMPGLSYVGAFRSGLKHGEGAYRITAADGKTIVNYTGSFVSDLPHGKGRLVASHGTYDGEWCNGLPSGHGKLIQEFTTYNGVWAKGLREGTGTVVTGDGYVLTGEWVGDRLAGTVDVSSIAAPGPATKQQFKDGILQTQYLTALVPVFHPDQTARGTPFLPSLFATPYLFD